MDEIESTLCWDATFATASALRDRYSNIDIEEVSLETIYEWVLSLPNFKDDAELATDAILMDIYREWFELIDG